MEQTTLVHISPMIVLSLSFCVTSIGMVGYLYYSDYAEQHSAKDGGISEKFARQKDVTVYEVANKDTSLLMGFPSKIQIMDDQINQRNNVL